MNEVPDKAPEQIEALVLQSSQVPEEKFQGQQKPPITASQAKIDAIADLTHSAYQKAGTLNLAKEESEQLQADFPDEAFKAGAAGKENLIYIEHAFLRDRFIKVFGMGAWALIPRSRWAEPFTIPARTGKDSVEGSRVYVEAMLVIRGCFVAEAIGEMEYYPKNASQNYGDAVEGATTAAFRRCAKGFGVGLQAWKKDWCEGWWARKRASMSQNRTRALAASQNAPGSTGQPAGTAIATPRPKAPVAPLRVATSATREWMINAIMANPDQVHHKAANEYFQKIGQLLPNEVVGELPLRFVPNSKVELAQLHNCLGNFVDGGDAVRAFEPHGEAEETKGPKEGIPPPNIDLTNPEDDSNEPPGGWQGATGGSPEIDYNSPDAPWRSFPMPWGKKSGVALADLEKNYLFGLFKNYKVEKEYNGRPKKPEAIAKDQEFRDMLDIAGLHYEWKLDEV